MMGMGRWVWGWGIGLVGMEYDGYGKMGMGLCGIRGRRSYYVMLCSWYKLQQH